MPYNEAGGAISAEGRVGEAASVLTDTARTLEVEFEVLREDSTVFFCDDPACNDCRLSWSFSTGRRVVVRAHKLLAEVRAGNLRGAVRKVHRVLRGR